MERWIFCLVLVFCLLIPNISLSDDWLDFQEFNNGFYFLDDHDFQALSCSIGLPDFKDMLDESRSQFKKTGDNILIEENLSDFQFTLKQSGELTFKRPDITVKVRETQGPQRTQLETGARMIDSGFKTTIDGAVITLNGLFSSYIRPKRSKYILESFQFKDNKAHIRYEQDGMMTDTVCSGMECTRIVTTRATKMDSKEIYMSAAGKKIIRDIHGTITQPQQTVVTDMSITYQAVKGLRIPFVINTSSTLTHATGSVEGNFNIFLKDCKVE